MIKRITFIAGMGILLAACSPKTTNPDILKLEKREQVLNLTSEVNSLKLDLEKELVKVQELTKQVEIANNEASKSSKNAKSISDDLSNNPGDVKLSSKANRAAKAAAGDAKKARKLNDALNKSNKKVESLQKEIEKTQQELNTLDQKIDFVPTVETN